MQLITLHSYAYGLKKVEIKTIRLYLVPRNRTKYLKLTKQTFFVLNKFFQTVPEMQIFKMKTILLFELNGF